MRAWLKRVAVELLPPVLTNWIRSLRRRLRPQEEILEYLPSGWDELMLSGVSTGWNVESVVQATLIENAESHRLLSIGGPFGAGHQHNLHVSFAYVLARAARNKTAISVLDWGSGLGHYCLVAKAAVPEISVDYHCKETPLLAAAGAKVVSDATWHSDEACLSRCYDVVMLSGSLQYAKDWQAHLRRIADATDEWLYITRLPVVENVATFAAIQRVYGSVMLHWQFNCAIVLKFVASLDFVVEREFEIGDRPYIKNAPEQCELRGWLFRRVNSLSKRKDPT
jgi:putative methyltransferase (TIGR04325 family)